MAGGRSLSAFPLVGRKASRTGAGQGGVGVATMLIAKHGPEREAPRPQGVSRQL